MHRDDHLYVKTRLSTKCRWLDRVPRGLKPGAVSVKCKGTTFLVLKASFSATMRLDINSV